MATTDTIAISNAAGDSAIISLYGAQVLSWNTVNKGEQLYCSPMTKPVAGQAIRGGVPICFPQFGNLGFLPKHGFARTSVWQLVDNRVSGLDDTVAYASFTMHDSELTRTVWNYSFSLDLSVSLGPGWIEILLKIKNTGDEVFDFTAALHSYLAVENIWQTTVHGLEMVQYLDALECNLKKTSLESPLLITHETDRIYLGTTTPLKITRDKECNLQIIQRGFADTVVWNPGPLKAAALGDMPPSDWTRMLCIEAAQIENPIKLNPGSSWSGLQRLET
jgi:glucose-6-phosphate 1-epimerase